MTTRIPKNVLSFLDQYAQPFGGSSVVLELLPDTAIEQLVTFPGPVYVVKPWSAAIDMREFGYELGDNYTILDNNLRAIRTGYSSDGYFGTTAADQNLLAQAEHGSFIYLSFAKTLVLLWICNKLSPRQVEEQVDLWVKQADQFNNQKVESELFISTKYLLPEDRVLVTFVPGQPTQRWTTEELRLHPNVSTTMHLSTEQTVSLMLLQSGWYLFELVRNNERSLLELTELSGTGLSAVRLYTNGVYYITVNQSRTNAVRTGSLGLPSNQNGLLGANPYIRLEAAFKLKEPDLMVGESFTEAKCNVIRKFSAAIEGSSKFVPFYSGSDTGTSIDGVATGIATISNPLLMESETLLLSGTASVEVDSTVFVGMAAILTGVAQAELDGGAEVDMLLTGEAEVDVACGVIVFMSTLQQSEDIIFDPLSLTLLTVDQPSTLDPLEYVWYTNQFQPYLYIEQDVLNQVTPINIGEATASAE